MEEREPRSTRLGAGRKGRGRIGGDGRSALKTTLKKITIVVMGAIGLGKGLGERLGERLGEKRGGSFADVEGKMV